MKNLFLASVLMVALPAIAGDVNAYRPVQLDDLKVDIKQMYGQKIAVSASIQTMGEMSMIKSGLMDMAPILANTDGLPRDDRKKLVTDCQGMCSGVFYGIIHKSVMGPEIILKKVEWE